MTTIEFEVIDNQTGQHPDVEKIALTEEWAKRLIYCDIDGFAIMEDGTLILIDDCNNIAYPPSDRFTVKVDPDSLRPKGRWELQVKSFYMDNFDESIELAVYITASCSECGENHPKPHSSGQVYSHHIYAPEDADDDFEFDQDEEKAKLLDEYMGLLKSGKMRLVNFCPNCGAKMEV